MRQQTLRLVDLPVEQYRRMRQHHDDMLREFALITLQAQDPDAVAVPKRLLELSDEVQAHYSEPRDHLRDAVEEAHRRDRQTVTVELQLPVAVVDQVQGWLALLEEADSYCRSGDLLTLEAPPDVVRFRRWLLGEVVAQLQDGRPPSRFGE
ncbi:MAG: hypothetical protein M3N52_03950 [Actinomycetota bacterium]|nr:hypothetical protein [Actinomycetota bacterium]